MLTANLTVSIEQDHRSTWEPSELFESLVVVGLHPKWDVQLFQKKLQMRKLGSTKKKGSIPNHQEQVESPEKIEPQVIYFLS